MATGQAGGVALLVAAQAGCEVAQYSANEVKQAVVGFGGATKDQVQRMVAALVGLDEPPKPPDVADALALAEHFADGQQLCVILGDNIIEGSIRKAADDFRRRSQGAKILLKEVPDAERFGVAEISGDRIVNIEEKPRNPKSNYAVTGVYMYDATVFDKVRTLVPSRRGELEITDVNNAYIQEGSMTFDFLEGWWTDAGTFDSLLRAANLVAQSVSTRRQAEAEKLAAEGVVR